MLAAEPILKAKLVATAGSSLIPHEALLSHLRLAIGEVQSSNEAANGASSANAGFRSGREPAMRFRPIYGVKT